MKFNAHNDITHAIGLHKRFIAIFYDSFIVFSLLLFATALALATFPQIKNISQTIFFKLYLLTIWWWYFVGFWTFRGQTPGMFAWKIKIISTRQPTLPLYQANIRFFSAFISFIFFGLGYFWTFFNSPPLTWHDALSKTRLTFLDKKPLNDELIQR